MMAWLLSTQYSYAMVAFMAWPKPSLWKIVFQRKLHPIFVGSQGRQRFEERRRDVALVNRV